MKSLKPWDGTCPGVDYAVPRDELEFWKMMIDEGGTVFYTTQDGSRMIWCTAGRLKHHMLRLERIHG